MKEKLQFKDRLQALIDDKKGNAYQLAEKIGVSHVTIGNYLGGQLPKSEHLMAISNHYGVSTDYLLFGREESLPMTAAAIIAERSALDPAEQERIFNVLAGEHEMLRHSLANAQNALDSAQKSYVAILEACRGLGVGESKPVPERNVSYGKTREKAASSKPSVSDLEFLDAAAGAPESGRPKRRPSH